MSNVIEFPKTRYILRCKDCKINAFYIYLARVGDPFEIIGYECTECDQYWEYGEGHEGELLSTDS